MHDRSLACTNIDANRSRCRVRDMMSGAGLYVDKCAFFLS